MSAQQLAVRIVNASFDELPDGDIIVRGVLDPACLDLLNVAWYQREVLSRATIERIKKALLKGEGDVPDIELGMRGGNYDDKRGVVHLLDPIFIIDGLQRRTAAGEIRDENPDFPVHLGARVRFNTTEDSERRLFLDLNTGQTTVSSNITLRDSRKDIPVLEQLYCLSLDPAFALCERVGWNHRRQASTLLTAVTYVRIVAMLHSHAGSGRSSNVLDLSHGLQGIMENVGRTAFIANVRTFFDIVDQCWKLKTISHISHSLGKSPTQIKLTFLRELARVFSNHSDFWKGDKLYVDATIVRKLRAFKIDDPYIAGLAGSSGAAGNGLYKEIVGHINYGRRRDNRLKLRPGIQNLQASIEEADQEDEVEETGEALV